MNDNSESGKLIREMNRYYDVRAPWHDYYMEYESNERMETLLRPIVDDVEEIISGKRVLEIACGTGNWTRALARRAEYVVAVDSSERAIEIARTKLPEVTNVTLRVGDAYTLDNIDGEFDVIFASDWWSHIPRGMIAEFLATALNKLRREGRAVFLDMSMREDFEKEPCHYDRDGNRISLRRLPDGSEMHVVKNFPTEDELRECIGPYADGVLYKEYETLKRWMVCLTLRQPDA